MTVKPSTLLEVVKRAAVCGWCGGRPSVRAYPQMSDDNYTFRYVCKHAPGEPDHCVATIDIFALATARDIPGAIQASGVLNPFPLRETLRARVNEVLAEKVERRL